MGGGSICGGAERNTGGTGLGVLVPTKHPITTPNQNVATMTQATPLVAGRTPRRSSIASLGASLPRLQVRYRAYHSIFRSELKDRLMAAVDQFNRHPVVHTWSYKLDQAA